MAALDNRCGGCFRPKTGPGMCPHCGCDETVQNAQHQLPVGTVLKEQYQIGKVLGQGGFGITYLGWDLYLDIPVAIKEYYPSGMVMRDCAVTLSVTDVSGDEGLRFHNSRERFMREAKMLARFSQVPEVVQVKNFFLSNNTAYIVMEYVEGITLKQFVKDRGGKLCVEETLRVLGPVIRTMAKIHRTGIVHRDISPDNIMMLPGGGAKVLDFGAVRSVDSSQLGKELTKSTEAILKQGYAPIEQYQKKGALGPWTDVYALCATIYYCLTGEVPPDAPARVLGYEEMDMAGTGLNENQQAALLLGMALRVEDRLHSMEELYDALFGSQPQSAAEPVVPEVKSQVAASGAVTRHRQVISPVTTGVKTQAQEKPEFRQMTQGHLPIDTAERSQVQSGIKTEHKPDKKKWLVWVCAAVALLAVCAGILLLSAGKKAPEPVVTEIMEAEPQIVHSFLVPGSNLYWTLYDDGAFVMTGTGPIPDNCDLWADYRDRIRSVTLDGEITRVGVAAFAGCTELVSVDFGEYVTEIESSAFENTGLIELTLPDTLTQIHDNAFRGTALVEVTVPDSVTFIGNGAFADCANLAAVTIGPNTRLCYDAVNDTAAWPIFCGEEGVIREDFVLKGPSGGIVEDYALRYGYNFQMSGKAESEGRGVVHDDITWWFDAQTGFLKLDGEGWLGAFGGSYIHYGDMRFYNGNGIPWEKFRDKVRVVSIGDGIQGSVSANLFENHRNLDDVYIGRQIENIEAYAFARTNIDWLHMPDSIVSIAPYAFDHCENLRHVVVSMGMWGLEAATFNQCVSIEQFFFTGWLQDEYQHQETPFTSREKQELTMPEKMVIYSAGQHNEAFAFAEAHGIPTAQGVDGRTYELMGHAGGRVYWGLEDGILRLFGVGDTGFFHSNANVVNAWHDNVYQWFTDGDPEFYPYREEIQQIIIEPGVTRLNKRIFADMPNLNAIHFGNVEGISSEAIVNCGMEKLVFPDTTHTVWSNAVVNCTKLKRVDIYNCEENLGDFVFDGCSALKDVYFHSIAQPGKFFLQGLEDVTIHCWENSPAQKYAIGNGIPNMVFMKLE